MGNELYHVMNRGVEKRLIAMDDRDRKRFVADLYAMNNRHAVGNLNYRFARSMDLGGPYVFEEASERIPLVQVHAWILMPNHYHLLVSEMVSGGLGRFLMKQNMGYTKYFNERHKRSGVLFQGRTKRVAVIRDAHYNWITHYIHLNALDLHAQTKSWRTQCLAKPAMALGYLEKYRWSSYRDYLGEKGFPKVVEGSFLYDDRQSIIREVKQTLASMSEFPHALALE